MYISEALRPFLLSTLKLVTGREIIRYFVIKESKSGGPTAKI